MRATPYEVVPLHAVKFTTTGDLIFYLNNQEFELLKDDPHVKVLSEEEYQTSLDRDRELREVYAGPMDPRLLEIFQSMPPVPKRPFVRVQPKRLTRAQRLGRR